MKNINIQVKNGSLNGFFGKIGSGKSGLGLLESELNYKTATSWHSNYSKWPIIFVEKKTILIIQSCFKTAKVVKVEHKFIRGI